MAFWNKKHVDSTFEERITALETVVSKLKREVLSNSMDIETLRDKVLRKIQKKRKDDEDFDKENNGGIDDDGFNSVRKIPAKT